MRITSYHVFQSPVQSLHSGGLGAEDAPGRRRFAGTYIGARGAGRVADWGFSAQRGYQQVATAIAEEESLDHDDRYQATTQKVRCETKLPIAVS
jgi:hypothetical protein